MQNLQKLARIYITVIAVNLAMLVIMIVIYVDSFSLLMNPYSWLGRTAALDGTPNTGSFLIFSATLIFNIFIWKQILNLLSDSSVWRYVLVRVLAYLVLAGFIIMLFPCDRFDPVHSTGGGLVKGGLWALSAFMLYYFRGEFNIRVFYVLQFILFVSVLFCGVSFLLDSYLKGFSQRPLLLAIIVITGICLKKGIKRRSESFSN